MENTKQFSEILHEWTAVFMHRSFRDFKHFMDGAELSASQTNTLMRLYHEKACSVSGVSDQLGVTHAATSQLVERLVQMNLLSRNEDPTDRRNKLLALTPDGRQLIERAITMRSQWLEELASQLTAEQQTEIGKALQQLTVAARKLETTGQATTDHPVPIK
jgi:DNA-binding MarR family transcriptional regulator